MLSNASRRALQFGFSLIALLVAGLPSLTHFALGATDQTGLVLVVLSVGAASLTAIVFVQIFRTLSKGAHSPLQISARQKDVEARDDTDFKDIFHKSGLELNAINSELWTAVSDLRTIAINADCEDEARNVANLATQLQLRLNDWQDIAKIEHGALAVKKEIFALHEVADKAVAAVLRNVTQQGFSITYEIEDAAPFHLLGDPFRLEQILAGMMSGHIQQSNEASLAFTISAEILERDCRAILFFVFERQSSRSSDDRDGFSTPIPRAIEQSLAEQLISVLGGEFHRETDVRSSFWLPYALPKQAILAKKPVAHDISVVSMTVIVAEGKQSNLDHLINLLQDSGHKPVSAFDGAQALRLVEELRPDILIVDMALPGLDGIAVAKHIASHTDPLICNLAIIGMTQNSSVSLDRSLAKLPNFLGTVTRPVQANEINTLLKSASVGPAFEASSIAQNSDDQSI